MGHLSSREVSVGEEVVSVVKVSLAAGFKGYLLVVLKSCAEAE